MKPIIIEIINIETIIQDQLLLFEFGFTWKTQQNTCEKIIKKPHNFQKGNLLLIYNNIIYSMNLYTLDDLKTDYHYFKGFVHFSRFYKINKLLKKDI